MFTPFTSSTFIDNKMNAVNNVNGLIKLFSKKQ